MSFAELENRLNALKAHEEQKRNIDGNTDRVFEKKQGSALNLDLTILGGSRPRLN